MNPKMPDTVAARNRMFDTGVIKGRVPTGMKGRFDKLNIEAADAAGRVAAVESAVTAQTLAKAQQGDAKYNNNSERRLFGGKQTKRRKHKNHHNRSRRRQ